MVQGYPLSRASEVHLITGSLVLHVLVQGPTCSQKTALVKAFAQISGQPLLIVSMHDNFEASEIIGKDKHYLCISMLK